MSTPPPRSSVLALHREALDAYARLGAELGPDPASKAWHRTTVADWSATEMMRHLLAVAEWYHEWLDRAEGGDADPPFPAAQLAGRNELEVLDRRDLAGPAALEQFLEQGNDYLRRLAAAASDDAAWNRPYGFAYGTTTTGLHAGAAAAEWHLHLWDLSDGAWQPAEPADLWLAAAAAMTSIQRRPRRMITGVVVHRLAKRDPWRQLLLRSGRTP